MKIRNPTRMDQMHRTNSSLISLFGSVRLEYLPRFGYLRLICMVNVGKYTVYMDSVAIGDV